MWKHLSYEFDFDDDKDWIDLWEQENNGITRQGEKHKNAEVIKAWAEGNPIQFRTIFDEFWSDWDYRENVVPQFSAPGIQWRTKPEVETYKFTNALFFNGIKYWVEAIMEDEFSIDLMSDKEFVRCIGDWQTVEVEK